MKKEKILNLIGIVLGIAIIIAGISIMKNPAETWSTSSVDSCRFGADFYTEQYAATRAAAHNAATTARNIDSLGEKIAQYAGLAFIFSGALVCLTYGKNYVYEWGNFDPNNHTGNEEIRGAVEATCTTAGYTGDTYCKDCDALLSSGTVIPATGHTGGTATCKDSAVCEVCHKPYGEKDAANHVGGTEVRGKKDATCTAASYTGDTYCKGCEALLSSGTAIPAAGEHTGGTPTCLRRAKCEVCGERYGDIDRSNHIDGCVPEWTVTETEHTQKYSRCGKLLTETGAHTFGDWTVTQEPTESEKGEQERVCTVCSCTETEAIPVAEAKASPSPAPAATPEPTAEPAAEPTEPASTGSAWWILLPVGLAGVAVGIGAGIAFRRRKKK